MLQALRNTGPDVAERVLANLAQEFLPRPFDPEPALDLTLSPYRDVLSEIRQKTNVHEGDTSQQARTKLLSIISQEISSIALRGNRAENAKDRLGAKKELPFKNYKLNYPSAFEPFEILGVRKAHVLSAFNDVDRVFFDTTAHSPIALFTSKPLNSSNDPFILLVVCTIDKSTFQVTAAIRLYYNDISSTYNYTLPELLENFLRNFGLKVRFKRKIISNLFLHEIATNFHKDFQYLIQMGTFVFRHWVADETKINGMYNFYFVFGIDLDAYREHLIEHGVQVGNFESRKKR